MSIIDIQVSPDRLWSLLVIGLSIAWGVAFGAPPAAAEGAVVAYVSTPDWHVPFTSFPYEVQYFQAPEIDEVSVGGGKPEVLVRDASAPAYTQDGEFAYDYADPLDSSTESLFAATPAGTRPHKVTALDGTTGPLTVSPDGAFIVFPSYDGLDEIQPVPSGGPPEPLTDEALDMDPAWGPDDQIAFSRLVGGLWQLFIVGLRGIPHQVTHGQTNDLHPSWSPDGSAIAFDAESKDRINIYTIHPDGTGLRRITDAGSGDADEQPAWSPDASMIAYSAWGPFGNDSEIMTLNLSTLAERELTDQPGDHINPTWVIPTLAAPKLLSSRAGLQRKRPTDTPEVSDPVAVASEGVARRKIRARPKLPPGFKIWLGETNASGDETCDDRPDYPWDSHPLITVGAAFGFVNRAGISNGEFDSWSYSETHNARIEAGAAARFCLYHLGPTSSATSAHTKLIYPSGKALVLKTTLTPHGPGAVWTPPVGTAGVFRIVAQQGQRSVSTSFRVVPADTPHIVQSEQATPSLGKGRIHLIPVSVTGQSTEDRLALDVYAERGGRYKVRFHYSASASLPRPDSLTESYLVEPLLPVTPGRYLFVLRSDQTVVDAEPGQIDGSGRVFIDAGALP